MNCKNCNSENTHKNGFDEKGRQVYRCNDCRRTFTDKTQQKKVKPKVGMTLEQFKEQYDTEYRLDKALKELVPDLIYEKQDILKLAGLSIGTPGATTILESRKEYYGKINSKMLFSHPDTIKDLKEHAKLN